MFRFRLPKMINPAYTPLRPPPDPQQATRPTTATTTIPIRRPPLGTPAAPTVPDGSHGADNVVAPSEASGPLFEESSLDSGITMESMFGVDRVVRVGNFPVLRTHEALYRRIWKKRGHIATHKVIKNSTFELAAMEAMSNIRCEKISQDFLLKWGGHIDDAERLGFNIGWLKEHFESVKKTWEEREALMAKLENEEATVKSFKKPLADADAKVEALRKELAEAEQAAGRLRAEMNHHQQTLEAIYGEKEKFKDFIQRSVLDGAV